MGLDVSKDSDKTSDLSVKTMSPTNECLASTADLLRPKKEAQSRRPFYYHLRVHQEQDAR